MEEEVGELFSLSVVLKVAGVVPIILGLMFILVPADAIGHGEELTKYGLHMGVYLGILAILFGLTHLVAAKYVVENLHVFGRLLGIGHLSIGIADLYSVMIGMRESSPAGMISLLIPFSLAFILLMYSQAPKEAGN